MKKLLNTLYVTRDNAYLAKEGQNLVIYEDDKTIGRFPIHILEQILCFSYAGCSPAVMRMCWENDILLSFFTPYGKFLGRVVGETNGNVLLRRRQYRMADDDTSLEFVRNIVYAKAYNSRKILMRNRRDHVGKVDEERLTEAISQIEKVMMEIEDADSKDTLRGMEGTVARFYFSGFDEMIMNQRTDFFFINRSRRPPLDRMNALLSFLYSLLTYEVQSALEGVGIDSYVGFFHVDRPGRPGMALDMMEELRGYMADRAALSMVNLSVVSSKDFAVKETGAVLLEEKGRKKVLEYWQKRKHTEITHPFLDEKIKLGLLPYVQAMLLNRYIRGDLEQYPPFLIKG